MKRTSRRRVIALTLVVILASRGLSSGADDAPTKVDPNDLSFYRPPTATATLPLTDAQDLRNVILCIGDGMGLSQITLARARAAGFEGRLYLERLPVTGLVQTHSANSPVTDSAAAATAMACGIKTNNGIIGMAPDEQVYSTILEAAQAKGLATGLVATSTISHATPAAFAAHVRSRKMEDDIARQLIANRVNVLFGGGRKFLLPSTAPQSGRKDDLDLLAVAREGGYQYIETADGLASLRGPYVLGLFQLDGLTTIEPEPSLALLTRRAIELLRQAQPGREDTQAGFFLVVEGSQIDWACHSNNTAEAVRQTLLFDQAVQVAAEFAQRDGRTLVIVTADHETGGLTLLAGGSQDKSGAALTPRWSTKGHSGTPVPLYALGPGATRFQGTQDNTEIALKLAELLDIKPFPRPVK
jgi:alkaline phosphatase